MEENQNNTNNSEEEKTGKTSKWGVIGFIAFMLFFGSWRYEDIVDVVTGNKSVQDVNYEQSYSEEGYMRDSYNLSVKAVKIYLNEQFDATIGSATVSYSAPAYKEEAVTYGGKDSYKVSSYVTVNESTSNDTFEVYYDAMVKRKGRKLSASVTSINVVE